MKKVTLECWKHIQAGESVWNGLTVNSACTAPQEPGSYTLYECVTENNTHAGWEWVKEAT